MPHFHTHKVKRRDILLRSTRKWRVCILGTILQRCASVGSLLLYHGGFAPECGQFTGRPLSFHWSGFFTKTFVKDDIGNFMKEAQVQAQIHRSKLAPSASGLDRAKRKYHGLNTFSIRFNKSSSCCRTVHKSLENQWCSSLPHTESSKLSSWSLLDCGALATVARLLCDRRY